MKWSYTNFVIYAINTKTIFQNNKVPVIAIRVQLQKQKKHKTNIIHTGNFMQQSRVH